MRQTFTISERLEGLNNYINLCKKRRGNYNPAQQYKKDIQKDIVAYIKERKVRRIKKPCFVSFTWYERNRRRDKDNVAFAKKFILDAMKEAGVLPDDGNRYLEGFADYFVYGEGQKVVVKIEEVDEIDK